MGFFQRIWRALVPKRSRVRVERQPSRESTTPPPPPPPPPPPTASGGPDFGGEDFGNGGSGDNGKVEPWDLPNEANLPFDFTIAGHQELKTTFQDGYTNVEGESLDISPGGDIDWPTRDFVVVHIVEPDGSDYYTTILGTFDDYDDFYDHLETWWVEGSPP